MTLWQSDFGTAEPLRTILTGTTSTDILPANTQNKQAIAKIHVLNTTAGAVVIDIEVWDGTTIYYLEKGRSVGANTSFEIYDEILQVGHALRAKAATGNVFHVSVLSALPQRPGG